MEVNLSFQVGLHVLLEVSHAVLLEVGHLRLRGVRDDVSTALHRGHVGVIQATCALLDLLGSSLGWKGTTHPTDGG